jgi:excinuclease ABC subunit C
MSSNFSEHIKLILKDLPKDPGVYQYFDENGKILYVGKAKNLRNRVRSYFIGDQYGKTKVLVKKISTIKYIIVETEQDALLLESNLIKKYRPPYNILLKDDKTYPWICIKNERFPRVISTRRVIKDGSSYFGPYTSVKMVNTLLDLIYKLFSLRNCNYDLAQNNINSNKYKVCLEYHIGNCKGACESYELEEDYQIKIDQIKNILKGNIKSVTSYLKDVMLEYSANLEFEKADEIKEKYIQLENYQARSTVVSPSISNIDVFSLFVSEHGYFVNYFKVLNGSIIQGYTVEVMPKLDENEEDVLSYAISDLRIRFSSRTKEIVSSHAIKYPGLKITHPERGDKKKLLDLSLRNAKYFALEKGSLKLKRKEDSHIRILKEMQEKLYLSELPTHIECFDNSNIQGTHPVSACVVFKDGKPSKKDYRHFNIKTVIGPDDFASMEEALTRRYSRLLRENEPLPQLIIIDGGKGQLSSSVRALDNLGLMGKIAIVGIAKRLEEIFFPGDQFPIYLDKRSECLKVIQHLRNEAHRFGITHHRNRRSKSMTISELDNISGIGEASKRLLLTRFKSVKRISDSSATELESCLGKSRSKLVFEYFNSKK